jgi:hypothetical protein
MMFDPQIHHRRSIRLKGYDYAQPGAYFVTLVTNQREEIFGEVAEGEMRLNPLGEIVREEWLKTAEIRSNVELHEDEFVILPNHLHGIIWIVETQPVRATKSPKSGDDMDRPYKIDAPFTAFLRLREIASPPPAVRNDRRS